MERPKQRNSLVVLGLLAVLPSAACLAGEGRLEINQTCAENGGCFAGDDAGFPVEISKSGSYLLTSDLILPEDTDGIELVPFASGSTLDLNGLRIQGPESCSGNPVESCTGSTTNHGINGGNVSDVTVRDGIIQGMAFNGINLGSRAEVENVRAVQNSKDGINVGIGGMIRNVALVENGRDGVVAGFAARVRGATARGNGNRGVVVRSQGLVAGSTARNNLTDGFELGCGASLVDSVAGLNDRHGVITTASCTASIDNVTAATNFGDGIHCSASASVKNSTMDSNVGASLTNECVQVGPNLCNTDLSC